MIINTPAVVLKSFPYGETSIIVRCYTKEQGKVSLIVKGARRKKSPLAAYFQPMNYLDLVYYYKQTRSLHAVSKASFIQIWSDLNQNLKKIAHALAILELTEKTNTDNDPHPELFNELISVLQSLDSSELRLNLVFWYYQIKLFTIMGFRPDFTNLEHGNIKLPDPFSGPNSENILNDLANNKLDSISNTTAKSKDRQAISNYLNTFMRYHFDDIENLKSLSVLKQIL
jgi:DNA repair protein RecO (recombination protein O)